ncbi:MAG: DUF3365 domain-containing protein [Saprospiraceae bacterium]
MYVIPCSKYDGSSSNVYNVKIKRTTLKARNESNKPDQNELEVLNFYNDSKNNGNTLRL